MSDIFGGIVRKLTKYWEKMLFLLRKKVADGRKKVAKAQKITHPPPTHEGKLEKLVSLKASNHMTF